MDVATSNTDCYPLTQSQSQHHSTHLPQSTTLQQTSEPVATGSSPLLPDILSPSNNAGPSHLVSVAPLENQGFRQMLAECSDTPAATVSTYNNIIPTSYDDFNFANVNTWTPQPSMSHQYQTIEMNPLQASSLQVNLIISHSL